MAPQDFGRKATAGKKKIKRGKAKLVSEGSWLKRRSTRLWMWALSVLSTFAIIGLICLAYLAKDLPDISKLKNFDKAPGIRIYATNGAMIASYGQVVGESLKYDQFPKELVAAVIATEDRRFFDHSGIDPMGLMRATIRNMIAGGIVQGGSTITQQLAKNVFLTMDRTFERKFQEVLLALWIENHFNKKEIMELYLNRVYLGAGNYGVDAAAHHYFNKSARTLNLQESALLAGLLKAPSRYAPTRSPEAAKKRTKQVLINMQDADIITEKEAALAISHMEGALHISKGDGGSYRYFTDWVVDQLPEYIGRVEGDMEVLTTFSPKTQAQAQEALNRTMQTEGKGKHATQAALLAMQPDGAIRAMIGGLDYGNSQFNRAVQAKRQPGSAFKLLVYLAALEAGYTPSTTVSDRAITIGNWSPKNYTDDYRGEVSMREAFYRSINTVAAMLTFRIGPKRVVEMAKRLGITSKLLATPSLSLGTNDVTLLEMTTAYADVAAGGKALRPFVIQEVRNKAGKLLYKRSSGGIRQVISTPVIRQMNNLLTSVVHSGTARKAQIGRPVAGKTGTTQDYRDAWFLGFTPQLVTGVWVGNDNYSPMEKVTGGTLPTQIWADFMKVAMAGQPILPIPTNIVYDGSSAQQGTSPDMTTSGEATLPVSPYVLHAASSGSSSSSSSGTGESIVPQAEQPAPSLAPEPLNAPPPMVAEPLAPTQGEGGVFDWYDQKEQTKQAPAEAVKDDTLLDKLYDNIQNGEVEYSYPGEKKR